jgi:RNA-directed DNA polymerase
VQGSRSPYDGDWAYQSQRLGRFPLTPSRVTKLLKKQKGRRTYCQNYFKPGDLREVDTIMPKSKSGRTVRISAVTQAPSRPENGEQWESEQGCARDKGCPREELLGKTLMYTSKNESLRRRKGLV